MRKTISQWAIEHNKELPKNSSSFLNDNQKHQVSNADFFYIKYKNKTRKLINWRVRQIKLRNEVVEVLLFMRSKNIKIKEISQITGVPIGTLCKFFSDMKLLDLNEYNIIETKQVDEYTVHCIPLF